jgi:DNA-binding PadR family transcriptional regulator
MILRLSVLCVRERESATRLYQDQPSRGLSKVKEYSMTQIGEAVYQTLSKLPIEEYDKVEAIFWQFKTALEREDEI